MTKKQVDKKTQARLKELRKIEKANGGVLQPDAVVAFAKNPKTALHDAFCWDDTEAAHQWRLQQARQLIRITITYEADARTDVKAYVALRSERYEDGGYRYMPLLMKTASGREEVLETALWELEAFEKKYSQLKELADVFAAIGRLRKKLKK
jgi:hypothetical protein